MAGCGPGLLGGRGSLDPPLGLDSRSARGLAVSHGGAVRPSLAAGPRRPAAGQTRADRAPGQQSGVLDRLSSRPTGPASESAPQPAGRGTLSRRSDGSADLGSARPRAGAPRLRAPPAGRDPRSPQQGRPQRLLRPSHPRQSPGAPGPAIRRLPGPGRRAGPGAVGDRPGRPTAAVERGREPAATRRRPRGLGSALVGADCRPAGRDSVRARPGYAGGGRGHWPGWRGCGPRRNS